MTRFYTEWFGMKVSRQRDVPKEKYSNAFMGFGSEKSHFAVELTYIIYILSCLLLELTHFQIFPKSTCALYHKTETTWFLCWVLTFFFMFTDYGVSSYEIEDGFGHFTISTQDASLLPSLIFRFQEINKMHGSPWSKSFVLGLQNGWDRPCQGWKCHQRTWSGRRWKQHHCHCEGPWWLPFWAHPERSNSWTSLSSHASCWWSWPRRQVLWKGNATPCIRQWTLLFSRKLLAFISHF